MATGYMPPVRRKVLIAVGTRPEAIKLVPLVRALDASPRIDPIVVASGQHPGIVEDIFAMANHEVDINLNVAAPGITLNELFSKVMLGFQDFFLETFGLMEGTGADRDYDHFPVACVVHGDTSTAAAAAAASFHLQIPVAHVEAGLRTSDIRSPFPEELNRQIISRIAAFHLAPTAMNMQNLIREHVPAERIFVTGNTAIDALMWAAQLPVPYEVPELAWLDHDADTPVVVVTAHRRENWGGGLERIGDAIAELAGRYAHVTFVLPVHPNPRVAEALRTKLADADNVVMTAPLPYRSFARLLKRSSLVITDSGGIQEEAPALGIPVLVMRDSTERQEGVDAGTLKLVGTDTDLIVSAAAGFLDSAKAQMSVATNVNPYGDGRASQRIVAAFEHIAFATAAPTPYGSIFNRLPVLKAGGFDKDPRARDMTIEALREDMEADVEVPSSEEVVNQVLEN